MGDILDFNGAEPQGQSDKPDRLIALKPLLIQNASHIVKTLFPAAVIKSGEARVGDLDGSPGSSLWIGLSGPDCGCWKDHATDQKGGDLISLYAAAEGLDIRRDFVRILTELESMVGLSTPLPRSPRQVGREAKKDLPNPAAEPLGPATGTWHYLDENSSIIATVYRHDLANGGKTYRPWDAKAGKYAMPEIRPLYNLPGILHAEPVILVEGEKCADALIGLGFAATTAMGGGHAKVDKTNWDGLKGKRVILWPDNDLPRPGIPDENLPGRAWLAAVSKHLEALGCKTCSILIPQGKSDGWDVADAINDGTDIPALIEECQKPTKPNKFRLLSLSDLSILPTPDWLIDNYLPQYGFSVLYGQSGSYKSFISLDMALHIANGMEWCGKHTQKRGIVYIAGEGGFGMWKRIKAWHLSHGKPLASNFLLLPTAVDLIDPKADLNQLIVAIEAFAHLDIGLIIIDTLARAFIGGDENSTQDMGAFITNCDRIKEKLDIMVMAVHHSGKDDQKGARGSSALRGAVDTELEVKRMGTTSRTVITCKKQKDAEEAMPISMEAVKIEVEMSDGEMVPSAIMRHISNPIKDKTYIGPTEKLILATLNEESYGLSFTDVVRKTNKSKSSVRDSLKSLQSVNMVMKVDDVYLVSPLVSPQDE